MERSSRHGAMFLHLKEPHASLLALLPAQQKISVVIEPGASPIHARLRASLASLDEGEFTEGHELDHKWRDRPHPHGRLRCGFS